MTYVSYGGRAMGQAECCPCPGSPGAMTPLASRVPSPSLLPGSTVPTAFAMPAQTVQSTMASRTAIPLVGASRTAVAYATPQAIPKTGMLSSQRTDQPLLAPVTMGPDTAAVAPSSSTRMAMSDATYVPGISDQPQPATTSKKGLIIGGLIAVVAVGGVAWWMLQKKGNQ